MPITLITLATFVVVTAVVLSLGYALSGGVGGHAARAAARRRRRHDSRRRRRSAPDSSAGC